MQGTKRYEEKFFVSFRLSERIPPDNFYRRLKEELDFSDLREKTKPYYGMEGHKSIDPEVFFKLMLVGYLENISSDRQIIEHCSLRLDILYFLGYDIDEPLPWHSTLSRTRKLFGEEIFLSLFRAILRKCVAKGMVSGRTQSVDSAFVKANASMDSISDIDIDEKSRRYFSEITVNEEPSGKDKTLAPGPVFNKRFASRTDPDARVSQKPGKPAALNYLGVVIVDASSHVVCGVFWSKTASGAYEG